MLDFLDIYLVEALINGVLLGGVLGLLALGLNLIFGVIDVTWICYAELVMIGMYGMYYLFTVYHVPYWVAAPICILLVAGLGALLHFLVIELVGAGVGLATVALSGLLADRLGGRTVLGLSAALIGAYQSGITVPASAIAERHGVGHHWFRAAAAPRAIRSATPFHWSAAGIANCSETIVETERTPFLSGGRNSR